MSAESDFEFGLRANRMRQHLRNGLWIDENGGIHISIPDLLVEAGLEDNAENRRELVDRLRAELAIKYPEKEIIEQELEL